MRYESLPGVNISTLKELWSKSPLHYHHLLSTPREETPAMALGTAVHMAVLEPLRFAEHYKVRPEGLDGRTTAGKAWLAQFGHLPILTQLQHQTCMAMRIAIEEHPVAGGYLGPGRTEVVLQWDDAETRIPCKGRPDLLLDDGTLVDLKTSADVSPRVFGAQAAKLGYHLQLAFYHDALVAMGTPPAGVVILAVESKPPHDVVVYRIPTDVLDQGREEYRDALAALCVCRNTNTWPGVAPGEIALELPRWAMPEDEDADGLDFGGEG